MPLIPFNKPYLSGKETEYIQDAVKTWKISGNGKYTKRCHAFFEKEYGIKKALLTTSCTDALEMAAILINTQEGDEIIMPSYTFVSTANAFILRGAKIVFADSYSDNPNIDPREIERLISSKTKAIVVVHYAGIACDMDPIMALAKAHNLFVIEDAAQGIASSYKGRPLGSIGHLAAFSFHETKNIISGEGGLLAINDDRFLARAEIIWEKGTNRSAFFRGEVAKYNWVDIGSSFLPSDLIAAFLFAQIESIDKIQRRRLDIWNRYFSGLQQIVKKGYLLPKIPDYATNNAHIFYLVCPSIEKRKELIKALKEKEIQTVFHYLPLHDSPYYTSKHDGRSLPFCDTFSDCLLRLPLFYELSLQEQDYIIKQILQIIQ